jgi:hypothetical protein
MLEVRIDDLLVLDVNKGREVQGRGKDEAKSPKWKPLDEEVGDERGEESLAVDLLLALVNCFQWKLRHLRQQ